MVAKTLENMANNGCKWFDVSCTLGEIRGVDEVERTESGTPVKHYSNNNCAVLEYYMDNQGCMSGCDFPAADLMKHVTEGEFPITTLGDRFAFSNGTNKSITWPNQYSKYKKIFPVSGLIGSKDHKTFNTFPNNRYWCRYDYREPEYEFPFNNGRYKPRLGGVVSGADTNMGARDFAIAAVYIRPRQIHSSVKTTVTAVFTTKMKVKVKGRGHGMSRIVPTYHVLDRVAKSSAGAINYVHMYPDEDF